MCRSKLILASASPRRKKLLKILGLKFKVIPSNVSEVAKLRKAHSVAMELALRKAISVAEKLKSGIVIGADTIVVIKGEIVGKPRDKKHARQIIKDLNGSLHRVYTGVALVDAATKRRIVDYEMTKVKMRKLDAASLKKITGKHMDKAGAYAIQEKDDAFVEKIYGDYNNVVGLPVAKLKKMIKKIKRLGKI